MVKYVTKEIRYYNLLYILGNFDCLLHPQIGRRASHGNDSYLLSTPNCSIRGHTHCAFLLLESSGEGIEASQGESRRVGREIS